jgi:hypothetical protein
MLRRIAGECRSKRMREEHGGFGLLGGFNLPMFIFFLVVTVIVAAPFLIWSDLSKLVVLLLAPVLSYVAIFALGQILNLLEGAGEEPDFASISEAGDAGLALPRKPEGLSCPSCGSKDLAVILYGLPAMTEELKKALANQQVTLGGCLVHSEAPQWACNTCGHKFGELPSP